MKLIASLAIVSVLTIQHAIAQSPTVVELFTSQGCSSCPPADKLLDKIAHDYGEEVIVLSYHVDYWDYIGWKDPYASKKNTRYQYEYGSKFRSGSVYTPQAVVNGKTHVVGSDTYKLTNALRTYESKETATSVVIGGATRTGNVVAIKADFKQLPADAQITYAVTVHEKTTSVTRGENRNKTLKNTHIVAAFKKNTIANNKNELHLELPSWVSEKDELDVIIYIATPSQGIVSSVTEDVNYL